MTAGWLRRGRAATVRSAHLRLCPRCGAPVLAGLDDDIAARMAEADPTPINEIGEAMALISGRRTFDLVGGASRKTLDRRDQWHIRASRRYPVLAQHECNAAPLPAAEIESALSEEAKGDTDEPGF